MAKREIDLYKKELRPLIRDANLYHVSARPDGVHWDGIEYWDSERKKGAVYAFRGSDSSEKIHDFLLKGLQAEVRYQLRFNDGSSPNRSATGRELMEKGLNVSLGLPNSSEIVFLEQLQ